MSYVIFTPDSFFHGESLLNHFNKFSPVAYRSKDENSKSIIVVKTDDPLAYGMEGAGVLGGSVRAYGIDDEGKKFKLTA